MSIQWFDRESLDRAIIDLIQDVDVVLDIGCGIRPQSFFHPKLHICCEPHLEYVQDLQGRFKGIFNVVIVQEEAQNLVRMMPDQSVDSIFLLDVVEHLEKESGRSLISECERIARRQIIVFTPLGFVPQEYKAGEEDAWGFRGGQWQAHKSGWTPNDFDSKWEVLASKKYHTTDAKGEALEPPFGAFWAIKERKIDALPVKLGVLSHILPPSPSGQAMVLYRLFRDFDPKGYCLISKTKYEFDPYDWRQKSESKLLSKYLHLPPENQMKGLRSFIFRNFLKPLSAFYQVYQRAKNILRLIRQEKCDALLACTGDQYDLPAGYLAARMANIKFYVYIFDDFRGQWINPISRRFARWVEPVVIRGASGVIVPNEYLFDQYRSRYKITPLVVHNPCEIPVKEEKKESIRYSLNQPVQMVYTGAVYQAHYDAFQRLIGALQLIERYKINLYVYTSQPFKKLEQEGICGPVIYKGHQLPSVISKVQQKADILFLPLAFDSPFPDVIRTSAPGKLGEYLVSGRPILVHAPENSFLAQYFKHHQCGWVVDQKDPVQLRDTIYSILENESVREKLIKNARNRAIEDFGLEKVRLNFLKLFEERK